MITSPHNDTLKEIRKLRNRRDRERLGRFVAEGEDLIAAADAAGWRAVTRLEAGVDITDDLLAGVSELGSGTRALAVYETRWAPAPAGSLRVYLHGVGDPGNVGTILRSAEAFGASCVAVGPGTADPFGPKAVRASMGAIFTVDVVRAADLGALGGTKIALDVAGEPLADVLCPSDHAYVTQKAIEGLTLVVGAEREGLPAEVIDACDRVARIPIANHSLNAAMAATVALYELTRRMAPA